MPIRKQRKVTAVYIGPECKWFLSGKSYSLKIQAYSNTGILFNIIGGRKLFPCKNFIDFMQWWDNITAI